MAIGPPHPELGYPATTAFYPVPVRRVRLLPPTSFRPRLATTPLPLASSSHHQGLQRTFTFQIHAMPGTHRVGGRLAPCPPLTPPGIPARYRGGFFWLSTSGTSGSGSRVLGRKTRRWTWLDRPGESVTSATILCLKGPTSTLRLPAHPTPGGSRQWLWRVCTVSASGIAASGESIHRVSSGGFCIAPNNNRRSTLQGIDSVE